MDEVVRPDGQMDAIKASSNRDIDLAISRCQWDKKGNQTNDKGMNLHHNGR